MSWPRDASILISDRLPYAWAVRRNRWRLSLMACFAMAVVGTVGPSTSVAEESATVEKLIGTFQIGPSARKSDQGAGPAADPRVPEFSATRERPHRRAFLTGSSAVPQGIDDHFRREAGDRVFFGSGSAEIGTRARTVIEQQADWLKRNPQFRLTIEGHADDGGTAEQNTKISLERAEALRDRLIEEGVEARRIAVVSRGRDDRIAACSDAACSAQNRRAVVVVHVAGAGERIGFDRGGASGGAPSRQGEADGRQRIPVPR